ncbi:NrfD/PsrC family molybdoenzyme membrane anchor subunit [Enteractinococcus helveticum]|uniref:Nitrite reductase n=1 Tax=Enteractinococcus helveticum TaxID=1837282 RepID=A0A1B7LZW6_9MICC|nr:NrfD/PsrC family molybdoenzyme membrane anchor subunit [Enteractinococcus helveticum]OAV61232.1 nitrite reductase [Enteractinococcus helveticum]
MTLSDFDAYRPENEPRRKKRRTRPPGQRRGGGAGDGSREMPMVEDVEFADSYYGRPIVKPPPWDDKISAYLFLGGIAGGSAMLAIGADRIGFDKLRRNTRLTALGATIAGTGFLVADLGRPERFHHMMRTFKPASPMNMGTWILSAFGVGAGVVAAIDVDRMTGQKIPLGVLRPIVYAFEKPAGLLAALMGAPLASYTGALLADTSVPTWNGGKDNLSYLFVSSAAMASSGVALLTTPTSETRPARVFATLGAASELYFSEKLTADMHPVEAEPLQTGRPARKLRWAQALTIAGGVGAALLGRNRIAAMASGAALASASYLTRSAILEAGINSTKDPRHVVEPQRDRLAARRAQGIVDDSITTVG